VEGGDDELVVGLVVRHASSDEPLMGGGQDPVVEGLLQGERLGVVSGEAVLAVVDRQAEPVTPRGVGQVQVADCGRQVLGIALLEAQSINLEIAGQIDQLSTGFVLAEVVADDSNQEGTPSDDSFGRCDRVYPVRPGER
jgi:hypothetical protein